MIRNTQLTIRASIANNKVARNLPLSDEVQNALLSFLQGKGKRGESLAPDAPLFCTTRTKKRLVPRDFQSIMERACVHLNMRYTPHDLRHTFGAELYQSTHSLESVRIALGHSSLEATKIYMHTCSNEHGQTDSLHYIAKENDIKSPTHAIDGGYIREWLVLGPFFPQDLNTDFLADVGGEASIQPQEGDTLPTTEGTSLTWRCYTAEECIIDLINAIGPHESATAYAFCILQSEGKGDAQIHLGSDDGVAVWINGKRVHSNPVNRNFILDEDVFEADLKVGANRCLIKVSQEIGDWEFAMRMAMLPKSRAILSGVITDETGVSISNADVRLEQVERSEIPSIGDGLVIAQTRTDASGSYQVSIHPVRGTYDLSATKGDHGDWQFGIRLREGERRKLNLTLKEAISISGRLLMLNEMTPHVAVPVQVVIPHRNNLLGYSQVIATTKSDDRGKYQFINLKLGRYQVRCQILDGYVYYSSSTNDNGMPSSSQTAIGEEVGEILHVEKDKTLSGIDFRFAPFKKGTWKNYTSLDGLAHNVVIAIYGVPDGLLWFGTEYGVSRYDGKEFVTFTAEDGLAGNIVYAIHHAPDDTMWFGTWDGGVSCYDGKEFVTFTTEDGLANNRVVAINNTLDGVMWFGTWGDGVSRYDGKKFVTFTAKDGLASNWIHDIYCAPDGVIWFATSGGVSRYDGKKFITLTAEDGLANNFVWSIYGAPDGVMWFATLSGVSQYDGKKFVTLTTKDGLAHNEVFAIHRAPDDTMWFTTRDGVSQYDGKTFVTLTTADGLANNSVRSIHRASDGTMWFGTRGGVSQYDEKELTNFTTKDGLASNRVNVIHADPDGVMWFGTSAGVSRYDGEEFVTFTTEDGLASNWIHVIHRAPDGVIWFGTSEGVSRYDGKEFVTFTNKDGLAHNRVFAIHHTPDGLMWFGTYGGISRYNGNEFVTFTTKDGLASNRVNVIHTAPNSVVWFGTRDGISRYEPPLRPSALLRDGKEFLNFTTEDGLAHNEVYAIYRDADGMMWFGTRGGISRYDGKEFVTFTTKDGLASNWVNAIHRATDGMMWFATDGLGVSMYDGITWMSLDTRDGLAGNNVSSIYAVHEAEGCELCEAIPAERSEQDSDGYLWFGTEGGITRYRRDTISPRARIVAVTTNRRHTDLDALESAIAGTRITFEYNSIDFFTHPEKRLYRYKLSPDKSGTKSRESGLEGYDTDWSQPTKATQVDYTDLPIGTYTFAVQAIDRNLNYSEPATTQVTVQPDPRDISVASLRTEVDRLRQEVGRKYHFSNIIGQSAYIKQVYALMERAIDSGLTVLISGETGTGKELVAKAIHYNSSRKDQPLMELNCGAIPKDLVASTLFGHRKGAFTGALEDTTGLFEAAFGGTLILDEIGEMPPQSQVHLLRVLQEQKIHRIGETRLRNVDVRVIAITNRDLAGEVQAGHFREALYYRLNVFLIHLPPLRERLDDIQLLAKHFLQKACHQLNKKSNGFGPGVMEMLQGCPWPGNVRELENEIYRAVALVEEGQPIQTYHFSSKVTQGESLIQEVLSERVSYGESLDRLRRRIVEEALRACDGNRTQAAKRLGMSRPNLVTLIKRLGIGKPAPSL